MRNETPQVRIREPRREGQEIVFTLTDDTLPPEHPARLFWEIFGEMDLNCFTAGCGALSGHPGRSELSPRMKLTLWAYALSKGITSAREIERRTKSDLPFCWIVGDLKVGHATLSDFLTHHLVAFRALLKEVLAQLLHLGLLDLSLVAQDGTRVLAWASFASFRKELALESCRQQAALHLKAVLSGMDDPEPSPRRHAARLAKARDFLWRINKAKEVIKTLRLQKSQNKNRKRRQQVPRASKTDPEARLMKLPDGSTAPAYNVQLMTTGSVMGGPVTVLGVMVSQLSSDKGSLLPMCRQVEQQTGQSLKRLLADADHATYEEIREAHGKVELIIPVPERWGKGPHSAKDEAVKEWQRRMESKEAKQLYRARPALCERPNSTLKVRFGLRQVRVRGVTEVLSVFVFAAVVNNILEHQISWLSYLKQRLDT